MSRSTSVEDLWTEHSHKLIGLVLSADLGEGEEAPYTCSLKIAGQKKQKEGLGFTAAKKIKIYEKLSRTFPQLFFLGLDAADENSEITIEVTGKHKVLGVARLGKISEFAEQQLLTLELPLKITIPKNLQKKIAQTETQKLIKLRLIRNTTGSARNFKFSYDKHISSFKTGDLIGFSTSEGIMPNLLKLEANSQISHIGVVVKLENKWIPGKQELYLLEVTKNSQKFQDPWHDSIAGGVNLFKLEERICGYEGNGSVFWIPLKSPLKNEVEFQTICQKADIDSPETYLVNWETHLSSIKNFLSYRFPKLETTPSNAYYDIISHIFTFNIFSSGTKLFEPTQIPDPSTFLSLNLPTYFNPPIELRTNSSTLSNSSNQPATEPVLPPRTLTRAPAPAPNSTKAGHRRTRSIGTPSGAIQKPATVAGLAHPSSKGPLNTSRDPPSSGAPAGLPALPARPSTSRQLISRDNTLTKNQRMFLLADQFRTSRLALSSMGMNFDEQAPDTSLEGLIVKMKDTCSGVPIADVKMHGELHRKCFLGCDAVDWLIKNKISPERKSGTTLGNELLVAGKIQHISKRCGFLDTMELYQFVSNEPQGTSTTKGEITLVFNTTLSSIMQRTQKDLGSEVHTPKIMDVLIQTIENLHGLETEGIFRVPTTFTDLEMLRESFNGGNYNVVMNDPHLPACCLKLWLRELSEPLITYGIYYRAINTRDSAERKDVTSELPEENKWVLERLLQLLTQFTNPDIVSKTKMDKDNLSTVFAPTVVRCPTDDPLVVMECLAGEARFFRGLLDDYANGIYKIVD